ncbi:MAG: hypothetical protein ACRD4P_14440, partial [Bryobacteraceae bacterium]
VREFLRDVALIEWIHIQCLREYCLQQTCFLLPCIDTRTSPCAPDLTSLVYDGPIRMNWSTRQYG